MKKSGSATLFMYGEGIVQETGLQIIINGFIGCCIDLPGCRVFLLKH